MLPHRMRSLMVSNSMAHPSFPTPTPIRTGYQVRQKQHHNTRPRRMQARCPQAKFKLPRQPFRSSQRALQVLRPVVIRAEATHSPRRLLPVLRRIIITPLLQALLRGLQLHIRAGSQEWTIINPLHLYTGNKTV